MVDINGELRRRSELRQDNRAKINAFDSMYDALKRVISDREISNWLGVDLKDDIQAIVKEGEVLRHGR